MKKLLQICFLLTLSACGTSKIPTDGSCNYQRNEIDDFTGKQIKETSFYHISKEANINGTYLKVAGLKNGDKKYLEVSLLIQGQAFNVERGKKLMFLDAEKNVTELIIPETKTSDHNGIDAFYVIERFLLDERLYQQFKNKTFVKVRYETMDGYLNFDIPESKRNVLLYIIKCI